MWAFAELIERCSDGIADQAAEEAYWASREFASQVLPIQARSAPLPQG
jgi:hypothetical protein